MFRSKIKRKVAEAQIRKKQDEQDRQDKKTKENYLIQIPLKTLIKI